MKPQVNLREFHIPISGSDHEPTHSPDQKFFLPGDLFYSIVSFFSKDGLNPLHLLQKKMRQQLENYFQRYAKLTGPELDQIFSKLTLKKFPRKTYLLEQDQICKHSFFILEGLVRLFYIDERGHEQITQFAIENWWVTSFESFIRDSPSYLSIQAVEETSAYILHKTDLLDLYNTIPTLNRIFRIIYENMLIACLKRADLYVKKSSRDRYYHFITHQPDFAQRVPQYMIASYLEITPEYLSELRRKK